MPWIALVLFLLAAAPPAQAQNFEPECRVHRLAKTPAARETMGGLGMPPRHLTSDEVRRTAECLVPALDRAFAAANDRAIRSVRDWLQMSRAYKASEHGTYLQVFANTQAAPSYARYEQGPPMTTGATIIKRAFRVEADGRAHAYRIYVMEKMRAGYEPALHDWRFAAYESNGALVGETGGRNDARVRFCAECHAAARAQDFLIYVPPTYRIPAGSAPR